MQLMATLRTGERVPVFSDWYSAKQQGYLSMSAWKRDGLLVPDEVIPGGVVVEEHGNVVNYRGMIQPVLDIEPEDPDWVVIAIKYYYVFRKEQTVTKPIPSKKKRELGESGSIMNGNRSEVLVLQGDNETQSEIAIDSVNNVRCYVPEGLLDLRSPIRNSVWYFLHLLYWKHLESKVNWDIGINLQYRLLEENIPNWRRVWPYCENRLVERVGGYAKGLKSYPYRTCSPYREQTHRLVTFEDKLLATRLRKAKKQFSNRPVVQKLRAQLDRISVNMDEFEAKYGNDPDRHYFFAHLQTICDKMIRFTEDDFSGRIHTNITNLYKPLRKLLRVDGIDEPLAEIDIKNSQPLFLGVAAVKSGVVDRKYLDLCQHGLIYDHMANLLGLTRDGAKTEFIKLLFSQNGARSTAKSRFAIEFRRWLS